MDNPGNKIVLQRGLQNESTQWAKTRTKKYFSEWLAAFLSHTIFLYLTNETNTKVSDYAARSAGCGHSVGKGLASAPASLPTSPTLIFLTLQSLQRRTGGKAGQNHSLTILSFLYWPFTSLWKTCFNQIWSDIIKAFPRACQRSLLFKQKFWENIHKNKIEWISNMFATKNVCKKLRQLKIPRYPLWTQFVRKNNCETKSGDVWCLP